MQELEQMIDIYHAAFLIFLILAILFLIVSIVLFFRFNIRGIFDMRTGRGARRTIQKMKELNDQTGKLRQSVGTSGAITAQSEHHIAAPEAGNQATYSSAQAQPVSERRQPENSYTGGSRKTDGLMEDGSSETTLLSSDDETTLLSQNQNQEKEAKQPEKPELPGAFKIEKEILWVHTEEIL